VHLDAYDRARAERGRTARSDRRRGCGADGADHRANSLFCAAGKLRGANGVATTHRAHQRHRQLVRPDLEDILDALAARLLRDGRHVLPRRRRFQGGSAADKLGVDLEKEPRGAREEGGDALAARRLSGVQQHLVDEEGDRVDKLLRVFHSLGEQRVLFSCCRTPRRPKT